MPPFNVRKQSNANLRYISCQHCAGVGRSKIRIKCDLVTKVEIKPDQK